MSSPPTTQRLETPLDVAPASAQTSNGDDSPDDYVNPLENSYRWRLHALAVPLRSFSSITNTVVNRWLYATPSATRVLWLDSTLGQWKGRETIRVDIWQPQHDSAAVSKKRTAVINFHAGGFIMGNGTDDARWAAAVIADLDAVVFSVSYRLAPGYPFPTAVEDCADAILQICARADEFGIDPDRIILSGFSAGATLSLASWVALQTPERWNYEVPGSPPKIVGFVLFYPPLDSTESRTVKLNACQRPDLATAKGISDLIAASYQYPPIPKTQKNDPRLSPGLMPDELLDVLPPVHLCLCEFDMLCAEGLKFENRLRSRGKQVGLRVVAAEQHGWDKQPSREPKASVAEEYREAINAIRAWSKPTEDGAAH